MDNSMFVKLRETMVGLCSKWFKCISADTKEYMYKGIVGTASRDTLFADYTSLWFSCADNRWAINILYIFNANGLIVCV